MEKSNDVTYGEANKTTLDQVEKLNNKINNWEFIFKSTSYHGYNSNGDCGIIAIQIILNYYDSFYSDEYIPERYDWASTYYGDSSNWKDWSDSPGSGRISGGYLKADDDEFEEFLNDIAGEFRPQRGVSMVGTDVKEILYRYKNKMNKKYGSSINYSIKFQNGGILGWSNDVKNFTKKGIDNNCPVILGGGSHYVVAYAYDDTYVYLNNGWNFNHRAKWSDFYTKTILADAVYILSNNSHSHCDNYYNSKKGVFICTCGREIYNAKDLNLINVQSNNEYIMDSSNYRVFKNYNGYYMDLNEHRTDNLTAYYKAKLIEPFDKNSIYLNISACYSNNGNKDAYIYAIMYDKDGKELYKKSILDYSKIYTANNDEIIIQFDKSVYSFSLQGYGKNFKLYINNIKVGYSG